MSEKHEQQQSNQLNGGSGDNCADIDKTNLIVNYIPQSTTVEDLMTLFKLAGDLESIKIMRHPRTGYSYGYGFVKYHNEGDANKAIAMFNRLPYRNKTLKVSYSRPACQVTKNANLYISNLPKNFTELQLQMIFEKFGEIIQKRLLKDKATGTPKGVAFVRYAKGEDAQKAISELNGHKLNNAQYPLRVRIADDYSQQRANLFYDITAACESRVVGGNGGGGGCGGIGMAPPYHHINRQYSPMSMRNHQFARYLGGGGDFNMLMLPNANQW